MTEQIKDSMETCRIIVHATEEELINQYRYNDAKEIEVALNDMLKAFRSLNAWEEVLHELEKKNALYMSYLSNKENPYDSDLFGKHIAVENCIDIINQHLAEIEK